MQSLLYVKGSNGAGNASQMTVQNVRSPGASDILVNTVTGVPTYFYGSMGAPHTFVDPVTGETITIISEATAVDFAGHIDTGKVVIDAIAPGYVDTRGSLVGDIVVVRPVTEWANNIFNVLNQSHNDDGTLKSSAITYEPTVSDYILSGGVWSALTGFNAAMTALTGYQSGFKNTIAAVASRAFTASKDTYVDVLRNTTTNAFTLVYTEVANGAASPVLAANSFRIALVATNGSAVTSVTQFGWDSLGNPISNMSPNPTSLGRAARTSTMSGFSAENLMTQVVVQVPASAALRRDLAVKIIAPQIYSSVATDRASIRIKEDGVMIQQYYFSPGATAGNGGWAGSVDIQKVAPSAGSHTYSATLERDTGSGTLTAYAISTSVMQISVDLK